MRIKICGITDLGEIDLLGRLSVDFVGLWHGVEGGHANLPFKKLHQLTAAAHATETLEPVLVTFLNDPEQLARVVAEAGIRWVQLHGFQSPALVMALKKAAGKDVRIVKVLHVQGGRCLERPLIAAYEKAGIDVFLFDAMTANGQVGSTGQTLDCSVIPTLAADLTRPFFLAGGVSSENSGEYKPAIHHHRFFGIDVDSNARTAERTICAKRIAAVSHSWMASFNERQGLDRVGELH